MEDLMMSVETLVRSTRARLLPHYGNIAANDKGGGAVDLVTALDTEIERYLEKELKVIDPDAGFVGEEYGGSRDQETFWLCDPIDGTGHYVRGLPYCSVMLARISKGEVTHSLIYMFVSDELYTAEKGKGAYKNGQKLTVSSRSLSEAYVGWETHLDKPENMEKFLWLRSNAVVFKTLSAGHEFAMVAEGKLEARIQFDPWGKDYDFAPGSLLVSEAGGIVANLGKRTYDFRDRNFIAANPKVFAALTEAPDAPFPV